MNDDEEFRAGAQSRGLVRVGDTVRRELYPNAAFAEHLLTELERAGFRGAPRFLGRDERGRQVLSYVPGTVPDGPPFRLSDARIVSAARLIRDFHDLTAASSLRGTGEIVCHGDLGPFNMVFDGDDAVTLIDFGDEVAPGTRAADFAHAVWCFADLIENDVPLHEQAGPRRSRPSTNSRTGCA